MIKVKLVFSVEFQAKELIAEKMITIPAILPVGSMFCLKDLGTNGTEKDDGLDNFPAEIFNYWVSEGSDFVEMILRSDKCWATNTPRINEECEIYANALKSRGFDVKFQ